MALQHRFVVVVHEDEGDDEIHLAAADGLITLRLGKRGRVLHLGQGEAEDLADALARLREVTT